MHIGLIDVDSKIPNLALMKLSAFHKKQDDKVEWFDPLHNWDIIYSSKIFNFTPEYEYPVKGRHIRGGSGHSLEKKLPQKIEGIYPDYSLYDCDYAMGFTTRGCIRNCPFCIVPQKEGKLKVVGDIYDFWDGQEKLMLLDNNLTAHSTHFKKILQQLIKEKIKVSFSQGLDIRLITPEKARLLSEVRLWKRIHFAWDWIEIEEQVCNGIKILKDNGVKPYKLTFYVLIGYNTTPEEDLYRVEVLRELGANPFVMPYNKKNKYQSSFSRWVNRKAIFKSCAWKDYKRKVEYA